MITATSAFGMGMEVENMRAVMHADGRRRLLDYGQESGRAGRDGVKRMAMMMSRVKEGGSREAS